MAGSTSPARRASRPVRHRPLVGAAKEKPNRRRISVILLPKAPWTWCPYTPAAWAPCRSRRPHV
eukprot:5952893-Pyramimonas_sp.AAC.1